MNEQLNLSDIYDKVIIEIKNSIVEISNNKKVEVEEIEEAKKQAQKILKKSENNLEKEIKELKENSEWNTFTMAFYGETNAGKSTLIETLRILLNEKTKLETRNKFEKIENEISQLNKNKEQVNNQIEKINLEILEIKENIEKNLKKKDNLIIDQEKLENIIKNLNNIDIIYDEKTEEVSIKINSKVLVDIYSTDKIKSNFNKIKSNYNNIVVEYDKMIEQLKVKLEEKRRNFLLKFLCFLFRIKSKEEKLIQQKDKEIKKEKQIKKEKVIELIKKEEKYINNQIQEYKEKKEKNINEIKNIDMLIENFEKNSNLNEKEILKFENEKKELEIKLLEKELELDKYQDGKIIGDGRSDFTQKNVEYNFDLGNQKFSIIDMPGIEGREEVVVNSITKAIQKAHMVFYITRKSASPETGEENRKGTIEKIKEQLGSQTEVWTIYNKSVTNKRQLNNSLTTEDERESLKEIDSKMKKFFNDNYMESLVISAKTAYLAVSECLSPNNIDYKRRNEFLNSFTKEKLLDISGITNFIDNIKWNFILNYKEKIKKSNYNKIKCTLKETIAQIEKNEEKIQKINEKFEEQIENSKNQVEDNITNLENEFYKIKSKIINNFESETTNEMYNYIELDVSNFELKDKLKETILKNQNKIEKEFEEKMKKSLNEFQESIKEITDNLKRYLENILSHNFKFDSMEALKVNLNIDIGIKVGKLLMVVVGAILMFWNPVGWIGMVLGGLSLLLGIADAVGDFFSKNYKMGRQRKNVDKNIQNIIETLDREIEDKIKEIIPKIRNQMETIIKELEMPLNQIKKIKEILSSTNNEIKKIKEKID